MLLKLAQENPPATESGLRDLKACLGSEIPAEVLSYLRESDGGIPDSNHDYLSEHSVPKAGESISIEYWLSTKEIIDSINALGDSWPRSLLPFAEDGNGNYLCVGQLDGHHGVFFWDFSTGDFVGPLFSNIVELSKALGYNPMFD